MKKLFYLTTISCIITVFSLSPVHAQKVNFSGFWKMNSEKCDFGMIPPPDDLTLNVKHKDINFEFEQTSVTQRGESKENIKFTTDGKETSNMLSQGIDVTVTGVWKENVLVMEVGIYSQGVSGKITYEFSLSADKKTMTLKYIQERAGDIIEATFVFDKGESPSTPK